MKIDKFAGKMPSERMNIMPASVSFENTANAFEYKTDKELKKARFLFSSMGYSPLVKLGDADYALDDPVRDAGEGTDQGHDLLPIRRR